MLPIIRTKPATSYPSLEFNIIWAKPVTTEHHDLLHEFAQYREQIHELKTSDRNFRKFFDEDYYLTKNIEKREAEVNLVSTKTEQNAKIYRVHLKDQLYKLPADRVLGEFGL
jgi:uncharacterized protein YdcH (DUF465 family)